MLAIYNSRNSLELIDQDGGTDEGDIYNSRNSLELIDGEEQRGWLLDLQQ